MRTHVGYFQVKSGKLRITDPCYDLGLTSCIREVNVVNGHWNAYVHISSEGAFGHRVSQLEVVKSPVTFNLVEKQISDEIGVDSGQCGIYDAERYAKEFAKGEYEDPNSFYGFACLSTRVAHAGMMDFNSPYSAWGVTSTSGLGDGVYPAFAKKNKEGEVVAIRVHFLIGEDDYDR